jgi:hypothetical protein
VTTHEQMQTSNRQQSTQRLLSNAYNRK